MQIPFNTSNASNLPLMHQSSIERNRVAAWYLLETYMRPPPPHVASLAHESNKWPHGSSRPAPLSGQSQTFAQQLTVWPQTLATRE